MTDDLTTTLAFKRISKKYPVQPTVNKLLDRRKFLHFKWNASPTFYFFGSLEYHFFNKISLYKEGFLPLTILYDFFNEKVEILFWLQKKTTKNK